MVSNIKLWIRIRIRIREKLIRIHNPGAERADTLAIFLFLLYLYMYSVESRSLSLLSRSTYLPPNRCPFHQKVSMWHNAKDSLPRPRFPFPRSDNHHLLANAICRLCERLLAGTVQRELRWVKIDINRTARKNCIAGKCHSPCPKGHHHWLG
jgi:hypothetical protein